MEMSVDEIKCRYREAKHKKEQVQILAEMNLCEKWEIVKVLVENGVDPRGFSKSMSYEYSVAKENGMVVPEQQYKKTENAQKNEKSAKKIEKSVELDSKMIEKFKNDVENIVIYKKPEILDGPPKKEPTVAESYQKTVDIQRAEIDKLNERIKELEKQVEHYKVKGFNEVVDSMVAENKVKQLEEKNAEYIELIQERNSEIDDLESEVQGYADENRVLHKKLKAAEKYILNLLIYEQSE